MTESYDPSQYRPDPAYDLHLHTGITGLWTATARLHACGHLVAQLGQLDKTQHRMTWSEGVEDPTSQPTKRDALSMLRLILQLEMDRLSEPPW